jgi:hypothetical protein
MLHELWLMIMENPSSTIGFIIGILSLFALFLTVVASTFVGIWVLQWAFRLTGTVFKARHEALWKSKTANLHDVSVHTVNEQKAVKTPTTHNLGVYSTLKSSNKTVRKNKTLN